MLKFYEFLRFLWTFFYRRFRGSTYTCTPHASKNDASCLNLPIPLVKPKETVSNFAFETVSFIYNG